jgi:hypothetical protein
VQIEPRGLAGVAPGGRWGDRKRPRVNASALGSLSERNAYDGGNWMRSTGSRRRTGRPTGLVGSWLRRKIILLMLPVLLAPAAAAAQGSITGCVTDTSGQVLPGVEAVASGSSTPQRAVTDSAGCYWFKSLPAGTYTVTAALVGFVTGRRNGITVVDGHAAGPVNFALCLRQLEEIDWIVPRGLEAMWKQADAVAVVRISATGPVRSECPNSNVEHTGVALEILKGGAGKAFGPAVTFVQEHWLREPTPYRIGQEMIVFLAATRSGFARLAGPYSVFLIEGDHVVSFDSGVKPEGVRTAAFLARLRALQNR